MSSLESHVAGTSAEVAVARRIPRRAVASWVLHDLANTIFSMGIVSLYFSYYVIDNVGQNRADSVYSTITAISMAVIFVASPLLGAATDRARRRMPFLIVTHAHMRRLHAPARQAGFLCKCGGVHRREHCLSGRAAVL